MSMIYVIGERIKVEHMSESMRFKQMLAKYHVSK